MFSVIDFEDFHKKNTYFLTSIFLIDKCFSYTYNKSSLYVILIVKHIRGFFPFSQLLTYLILGLKHRLILHN